MFDEFYTDRLRIKQLTKEDAIFIFVLLNTPGWIRFIGNRNISGIEDAENYIEKISSDPNSVYWTIRIKENNTPVGVLTFIKRSYLEHHDIGFAVLPEFEGQGIVREACEMLIFKILQADASRRLLATVYPQNAQSIGLLKRLGFTFQFEQIFEEKFLHVYALN